MSVDAALEAHPELAERRDPGMSAFDDPAMPARAVVALDAPARDPILDAAYPEMLATTHIV